MYMYVLYYFIYNNKQKLLKINIFFNKNNNNACK